MMHLLTMLLKNLKMHFLAWLTNVFLQRRLLSTLMINHGMILQSKSIQDLGINFEGRHLKLKAKHTGRHIKLHVIKYTI